MRRSGRVVALAATAAAVIATPASAGVSKDHAQRALNILPSGQYGDVPPPPQADEQARMYDALTPLFDQVGDSDLDTYFKSELFGVGPRRADDG